MSTSDSFAFEMVRRPACPELAGHVIELAGYRETGAGHLRQIELASLIFPLVVSFGTPFKIGLGRMPSDNDDQLSFAAGLFAGPVIIDSFGGSHCLQINFTPLGASAFFRLPPGELTDRMVALDQLGDPALNELPEKLAGMTDWESRFDMVERLALNRIRAARQADARVSRAYHRILASGGAAPIGRIAAEIDLSRKHLAGLFAREIGLSPKTVARIIRFGRAADMARRPGSMWADIAAASGYADQAHLSREFHEFAGQTPAEWQAAAAR